MGGKGRFLRLKMFLRFGRIDMFKRFNTFNAFKRLEIFVCRCWCFHQSSKRLGRFVGVGRNNIFKRFNTFNAFKRLGYSKNRSFISLFLIYSFLFLIFLASFARNKTTNHKHFYMKRFLASSVISISVGYNL